MQWITNLQVIFSAQYEPKDGGSGGSIELIRRRLPGVAL